MNVWTVLTFIPASGNEFELLLKKIKFTIGEPLIFDVSVCVKKGFEYYKKASIISEFAYYLAIRDLFGVR